jgi:L-phenylalanine/L-methionine N-acetyltransferase
MEIAVRHAEPDDYAALHRVFTSPRVVEGTLQLPYQSAETRRKRLVEPAEGQYSLVAVVDGEVVGQLGLYATTRPRRRHVGELGMGVRDDWQGRGVGSALMKAALDLADNWLNLTRVELTVYTDNAAAIALYTKFGFEVEGTHRAFAYRNGQYVDAHSMARLRLA